MGKTDFDQIELNKETPIASPSAVVSVAAPTKAEFDKTVVLLNEIKTKLNTIFKG